MFRLLSVRAPFDNHVKKNRVPKAFRTFSSRSLNFATEKSSKAKTSKNTNGQRALSEKRHGYVSSRAISDSIINYWSQDVEPLSSSFRNADQETCSITSNKFQESDNRHESIVKSIVQYFQGHGESSNESENGECSRDSLSFIV